MRLSVRGDYGIRAVLDLARHYGNGLTLSGDIAARQLIPGAYLQQLLLALRKAGLAPSGTTAPCAASGRAWTGLRGASSPEPPLPNWPASRTGLRPALCITSDGP